MSRVLFLHGFTQTGGSWDEVRAELGGGYTCVAPDLPGHGLSSTRATLDAALAELAPHLPAVVCGYSMGGRIALHLALRGGVERLILLGASPGLDDPAPRLAADRALADRIEREGLDAFVTEWAAMPMWASQSAAVRARADAERRRNTAAGLAAALRGLGTGALPSLWGRLGSLRMPVALVVGERDEKFRRIAEAMKERIPDVELHVVPGAGHALNLEAPAEIAEVVRSLAVTRP